MSNDCGWGPMSLILSAVFLAFTMFLSSVRRIVENTRRCLFHFERIDGVVTPGCIDRSAFLGRWLRSAAEISVSSIHGVCCVADPRQSEEYAMKKAVDRYVLSFESESVRNKQKRHHWMICLAKKPDKLVSWGHA